MPIDRRYIDLLDANAYLRKASESFYFQCTARTVQESKLFPVNPYEQPGVLAHPSAVIRLGRIV